MALPDNYAASLDPRVISQVTAAIYLEAQTVYTEASPPANHPARAAFATNVVTGKVNLQPLILSACCFASLTAASTDTTVNNAVAALWNTWAGA
jgi:hypothetical protein